MQADVVEFEAARPRLLAVAYRLLGSASEAEDAVQDTFLRWDAADRDVIVTPVAWLTKVVTNLCLTRLTSARARREQYVGISLPEPIATDPSPMDPLATVQQRESVSIGMLVLMERLTPSERAVFVLREAFSYAHRDIAEVLAISEANSQQLLARARGRLAAESHRFDATDEKWRGLVIEFLNAAAGGDRSRLERLLADDVTSWADGGGHVQVARRPIIGPAKVARYLQGWLGRMGEIGGRSQAFKTTPTELNGEPGVLITYGDYVVAAMIFALDDGRVAAIRTIANPEKLNYLAGQLSMRSLEPEVLARLLAAWKARTTV